MRASVGVAIVTGFACACGTLLGAPDETPTPPTEAGTTQDAAPDVADAEPADGADAGFDADDGGLAPPEAGSIACGQKACESVQAYCCEHGTAAPTCETCLTCGISCTFAMFCDEPADCPVAGESCILMGDQTSCPFDLPDGGDYGILCAKDDDCPGKPCTVTTCRGVRMRLCGGFCPPH